MVTAKKIAPESWGEVKVTFNSRRYKGEITKIIDVESNVPDNPIVYLRVKATVLPEIKCYFFHFQDCKECEATLKDIFPPLSKKYNLHIKFLNLDEHENYELLSKIEGKYEGTENEPPVVVIGEHILRGKEEIQKSFEQILQKYKQNGCKFPDIEAKKYPTDSLNIKKIYLAYFYTRKCKECNRITYELKYLQNKYSNLYVKRFDIDILENRKLNEELCKLYKVPQEKRLAVPSIFVGDEFLVEKEVNSKNMLVLIEKYGATGTKIPWEQVKELKRK